VHACQAECHWVQGLIEKGMLSRILIVSGAFLCVLGFVQGNVTGIGEVHEGLSR